MDLVLDLKKYCIETKAKKKYEQLVRSYFCDKGSDTEIADMEARILALKYFLEHADFSQIRSAAPELGGHCELPIALRVLDDYRELTIVIGDRIIQPQWKPCAYPTCK
ncbi:MAG: hypothetical protein HQK65_11955 [Desulfamplus sp.]|nr:hypothetical protein [Desulfamplus sp.]